MKVFEFRVFNSPELTLPLPQVLYNEPEYVAMTSDPTVVSFLLKVFDHERPLARIHFNCTEQRAKSHWRAPFGCLETAIWDEAILESFWQFIEAKLKELGVENIEITSWPPFYSPYSDHIWALFQRLGFREQFIDLNFHVPVTDQTALSHFKKAERKRLRKCQRIGLKMQIWKIPDGAEVHAILTQLRSQKGIPLNISPENLTDSFLQFPDRYLVFYVKNDDLIIAISVCVKVNDTVLYHFCLACSTAYNTFSPSVLLYASIYEYCQEKGFKYFDFGTASIRGIKQEGLFKFKQNLGGQETPKPSFYKCLI